VLAFSVSARTREFGVRLAIGSTPRQLLTRVLLEGAQIAATGIVAGVAGGYLLARIAESYFETARMPGVLPVLGAAIVLMGAAVVASLVPRRVLRVWTCCSARVGVGFRRAAHAPERPNFLGEYLMKHNVLLKITSLLSLLLLTLHVTDDIRPRDIEGRVFEHCAVVLVVFLYGTLVLAERRSGSSSFSSLGCSRSHAVVHMRGVHYPEIAASTGGFFFVWTLWALGALGAAP